MKALEAIARTAKAGHGEAPSNWLSKKIDRIRKAIKRRRPTVEQREERNAIVAAIYDDDKGQPLRHPDLGEIVWGALAVANHIDAEQKRRPIARPSSSIEASWYIHDQLGVPRPEPEF